MISEKKYEDNEFRYMSGKGEKLIVDIVDGHAIRIPCYLTDMPLYERCDNCKKRKEMK